MIINRRLLLLSLLVAMFAACCHADEVVLNNGSVIRGTIESQTAERLRIKTQEGLLALPSASVRKITRSAPEENIFNSFQQALARGDIKSAFEEIDRYGSAAFPRADLDKAILQCEGPVLGKASAARAEEAMRFARHVRERPTSAPEELGLLLAQYFAAQSNTAEALAQYRSLSQQFLARNPAARDAAAVLAAAEVREALDAGDADRGLDALRAQAQFAPDGVSTQSVSAALFLNEASALERRGDYAAACGVLCEKLRPLALVMAREQAMKILKRAEIDTTGSELSQTFDKVLLCFDDSPPAAELAPVLERQSAALARMGRLDDAMAAAERLSALNADAGAAAQHRVEYARRAEKLASDDYLGHYELGIWAWKVMSLRPEARQQFLITRNSRDLRENAGLQIQLMSVVEEKECFEKLSKLLVDKQYAQVMKMAKEFSERYPRSELTTDVKTLGELARFQSQHASSFRSAQADALYQNAERMYLQERYSDALNCLNRLETDYPDTESGRRASAIREKIVVRMQRRGNIAGASAFSPSLVPHNRETTTVRTTQYAPDARTQGLVEIRRLSDGLSIGVVAPDKSTPSSQRR
ncbi:MAG: hypothetical protein WCK47_14250 [bacterium]